MKSSTCHQPKLIIFSKLETHIRPKYCFLNYDSSTSFLSDFSNYTVSLYESGLCVRPFGCVEEHRTFINISSWLILLPCQEINEVMLLLRA